MDKNESIRGNEYNSSLISPRIAGWAYCSGFETYWNAEQFIDIILAESITQIYIPKWELEQFRFDMEKVSNIAQHHIEIIDKNKKIFANTQSIINDIAASLIGHGENERNINYALKRIFEALYHLRLSKKFSVNCDISRPLELSSEIDFLNRQIENPEDKSFLCELKGILNLYAHCEIMGNIIYEPINNTITKLIGDLLVDSTFLGLSKEKRNFTLNADLKLIPKIKLLARKLSRKRQFRKYVQPAKYSIAFIPQKGKKVIETFSGIFGGCKGFNPCLVDVDKIASNRLKNINPHPLDISTEETVFHPYSVYELFETPGSIPKLFRN